MSTHEPKKEQNSQLKNNEGISDFNILGSMDIMGATSGYTPEQTTHINTANQDEEGKMQLETAPKNLKIETPINQEITERELLEFDKIFDDYRKTKLIENAELEGVVRPRPLSGKSSIVKNGLSDPHKSAKAAKKVYNEPVIRDGWLEIPESSGILRRGETFMCINEILTKCNFQSLVRCLIRNS